MKPIIGTGVAAAVSVVCLLLAPIASAQQQQQPSDSSSPATSAKNIPDAKLDAVAAAAKKVTAVSDTYKEKLAKAPTADKERVVDEANAAIAKAVTDQGLSVEEYVSIMKVAQNDPVVRDKIVQRLK
jgi:uncharacterized protein DUF4168